MTAPAPGPVVATSFVAATLASMPFGVSLLTLMLGGACFLLGIAARAGAQMFKKLDGTQDVTIKDFIRPIAAILCMIPVAAAASCIVFLLAHVSGVKADAGCGGLLLILGLRGLEGFQWLTGIAANIFMKYVPEGKSGGGTP